VNVCEGCRWWETTKGKPYCAPDIPDYLGECKVMTTHEQIMVCAWERGPFFVLTHRLFGCNCWKAKECESKE
jgi:hypothetical protein